MTTPNKTIKRLGHPLDFCVHHVGGRSGTSAFPYNANHDQDLHWYLYDADEDCVEQARTWVEGSHVEVHPYCIGQGKGDVTFNITFDPYKSSIHPFNEQCSDFYKVLHETPRGLVDYEFSAGFQPMRQVRMPCHSLDELLNDNPEMRRPEVLSLDCEGGEHEVLTGAQETLTKDVLAAVMEVEFVELFRGQKLFTDICSLMEEKGFQFCRFTHLAEAAKYRQGAGLRGQGFHVGGKALFLKSLDALEEKGSSEEKFNRLTKMAYAALGFELMEYALESLRRASHLLGETAAHAAWKTRAYTRFLSELLSESEKDYPLPVAFADIYDFESSQQRFSADANIMEQDLLQNFPLMVQNLQQLAKERGAARLCILPYGKLARTLTPDILQGEVPVRFFDNGSGKTDDDSSVQIPSAMTPDDVAIIASTVHEAAIRKQLVGQLGLLDKNIFSCHTVVQVAHDGTTGMENLLLQEGFTSLANLVQTKRQSESTHLNPLLSKQNEDA